MAGRFSEAEGGARRRRPSPWPGRRSPPGRRCCCSGARPTVIRAGGSARTPSTCPGPPPGTWASEWASQCTGQHVAHPEAEALLLAVLPRVRRIQPAGKPERHLNSTLRAWGSPPVRVELDG